ncbi:uncharacterized protein LOC110679694 [Aedes aegypti]|uniref:Uncharacterized protein n=1 Tax=Aedes aegypti TaxID=7159 RepID=A0A6I8U1B4_AEDAE|nr:uncharacterized protein LOC110679694 [Aedes aegypti]
MGEHFFRNIQKDVGIVLPHLKNILELEGLAGNEALGKLDNEDILAMQAQMRFRVERVRRIVANDPSKSLEDYYGDYVGQPELFSFTAGDLRVLQTLAVAVGKNGLQKYLAAEISRTVHDQNQSNYQPQPVADEHSALVSRLLGHFKQCMKNDQEWQEASRFISSITTKFEIGSGGKIVGLITCPACKKKGKPKNIKIVKEATRSWPLFNIVRHFNTNLRSSTVSINAANKQKRTHESSSIMPAKLSRSNNSTVGPIAADANYSEPSPGRYDQEASFEMPNIDNVNEEGGSNIEEECLFNSSKFLGGDPDKNMIDNDNVSDRVDEISQPDSFLVHLKSSMHHRLMGSNLHARRYTEVEKDIMTYEYLTAGNSFFEYTSSNTTTMCKKNNSTPFSKIYD